MATPSSGMTTALNIFVGFLTLILILFSFVGVAILIYGFIMTVAGESLLLTSDVDVINDVHEYVAKNKLSAFMQNTTNATLHFTVLKLVSLSFHAFHFFGEIIYIIGFGIIFTLVSVLIGFSLQNVALMGLSCFINVILLAMIIPFVLMFNVSIERISKVILNELYNQFDADKCSVCWSYNPSNYTIKPEVDDQLTNVIMIGSAIQKCCGITTIADLAVRYNSTLLPLQCCKDNVTADNCNMEKNDNHHPPCLEKFKNFFLTHTTLRHLKIIFLIVFLFLLIFTLFSLFISCAIMSRNKLYCFASGQKNMSKYSNILGSRTLTKSKSRLEFV